MYKLLQENKQINMFLFISLLKCVLVFKFACVHTHIIHTRCKISLLFYQFEWLEYVLISIFSFAIHFIECEKKKPQQQNLLILENYDGRG